jgi:hypothetical protein
MQISRVHSVRRRYFRIVESVAAKRNLTVVQEGGSRTRVRLLKKYQSTIPRAVP